MDDELQFISLRTKKNWSKFLSPSIQFSPIMPGIWEIRNKTRKKTRKTLFKYRLYYVSSTSSCALSEIISKMKREDNLLQKSEMSEATSTSLEINFLLQNLGDKLVLCIHSENLAYHAGFMWKIFHAMRYHASESQCVLQIQDLPSLGLLVDLGRSSALLIFLALNSTVHHCPSVLHLDFGHRSMWISPNLLPESWEEQLLF